MVEIKQITVLDPLYQLERELRNKILLRPFGLADHAWEMKDDIAWHFIATENNSLIGCVILVPIDNKKEKAQLMQMAVDNNTQGKGIGRLLVIELLEFCKQQDIKEVSCHSRVSANGFYEKLGFRVYDEAFEEAGIMHNHMRIIL